MSLTSRPAAAGASSLSRASDIDTTQLSEDVSSLLRWGRDLLQQQRAQRQPAPAASSSTTTATTALNREAWRNSSLCTYTHVPQRPPTHSSGVAAPLQQPSLPQPPPPTATTTATANTLLSVPRPSLHTQQSVQALRERLTQLTAREAANAESFARRLSLLRRGRDRLVRQARPDEAAHHERNIAAVVTRVQAVVEGEEGVCEALRDVLWRLTRCRQRQQQLAAVVSAPLGEEYFADGSSLSGLVHAIQQRAQDVVHAFEQQQRDRAAQAARARAAQRRRAEVVAGLEARRHQLSSAVQRTTAQAEQREEAIRQLRTQLAARAEAAALRVASAHRRQALDREHQRLAALQETAALRNDVEREEAAASEASCREVQAAYDSALHERDLAEAALRDARAAHRRAEQSREAAVAALAAMRAAVCALEERLSELRAHIIACEEDTEALQDDLQVRRPPPPAQQLIGMDAAVGAAAVVDDATKRRAALRCEITALTATRREREENVTALREARGRLLNQLRQASADVAALQAQKAALESYLVSEQSVQASLRSAE